MWWWWWSRSVCTELWKWNSVWVSVQLWSGSVIRPSVLGWTTSAVEKRSGTDPRGLDERGWYSDIWNVSAPTWVLKRLLITRVGRSLVDTSSCKRHKHISTLINAMKWSSDLSPGLWHRLYVLGCTVTDPLSDGPLITPARFHQAEHSMISF